MTPQHPLMRWLDSSHIQDDELGFMVEQFEHVARQVDTNVPDGSEKTTAIRKLIEAKDAACRAVIEGRDHS